MSRGTSEKPALRVGDAERDACIEALIDHHLHGRLSAEEFDRRQCAALVAVSAADLTVLLDDLPQGGAEVQRWHLGQASSGLGRLVTTALPAGAILGGAAFSQWAWQYSAEGPFIGALAGGALGYAAHALVSRFKR